MPPLLPLLLLLPRRRPPLLLLTFLLLLLSLAVFAASGVGDSVVRAAPTPLLLLRARHKFGLSTLVSFIRFIHTFLKHDNIIRVIQPCLRDVP